MATTIQMPPLKGDIAVNGNYFMIRFFICCGLYILSHSPVIVEWYRKAPSAPVRNNYNYYCNQGCNCVGSANKTGPVNPPKLPPPCMSPRPGLGRKRQRARPLINEIRWPASPAQAVAAGFGPL
ncbi:hypothetical protein IFM61606_03730 [Aspergillus udagawae]|nr:hypothetical protein IFM61606_03730 [Aspergillus udagawae]